MWFRNQKRNRRLHRHHVLDVKLRSDQVRANRLRLGLMVFLVVAGPFFGIYLLWQIGQVALNVFVYENADFAVQQVEVQTDGVIAPDQLRRWTKVKPGVNLIALDLAEVKRNLELYSMVASVSVERVLPRTLKIRVTERDPIAQVNVPRTDASGSIVALVYHLDADGMVMQPLDARYTTVPVGQVRPSLPVIAGLNAFQLQVGRRVELPQVQAALRLLAAFEHSPMAGLVDIRRLDVSAVGVVVATTAPGSEITFAMDNLEQQLARWRSVHDLGARQQKTIAAADFAVANNVPVRWMTAAIMPEAPTRTVNPPRTRRRHV